MAFYWRKDKISYFSAAVKLKKNLPSLQRESVGIIEDHLRGSNLEFYEGDSKRVPVWIRFTVVPALLFFVLLSVFMPINFLFTGRWGYNKVWIANWFKALGW